MVKSNSEIAVSYIFGILAGYYRFGHCYTMWYYVIPLSYRMLYCCILAKNPSASSRAELPTLDRLDGGWQVNSGYFSSWISEPSLLLVVQWNFDPFWVKEHGDLHPHGDLHKHMKFTGVSKAVSVPLGRRYVFQKTYRSKTTLNLIMRTHAHTLFVLWISNCSTDS
jgi:hypothetical protein